MSAAAENIFMPAGLGIIEHPSDPQLRMVIYEVRGDQIVWARHLGRPPLELTAELSAAIWDCHRGTKCLAA